MTMTISNGQCVELEISALRTSHLLNELTFSPRGCKMTCSVWRQVVRLTSAIRSQYPDWGYVDCHSLNRCFHSVEQNESRPRPLRDQCPFCVPFLSKALSVRSFPLPSCPVVSCKNKAEKVMAPRTFKFRFLIILWKSGEFFGQTQEDYWKTSFRKGRWVPSQVSWFAVLVFSNQLVELDLECWYTRGRIRALQSDGHRPGEQAELELELIEEYHVESCWCSLSVSNSMDLSQSPVSNF